MDLDKIDWEIILRLGRPESSKTADGVKGFDGPNCNLAVYLKGVDSWIVPVYRDGKFAYNEVMSSKTFHRRKQQPEGNPALRAALFERFEEEEMAKRAGFLTVKELAELLEVSEKTIYNWIRRGMPHLRSSLQRGKIFFKLDEVEAWMRRMGEAVSVRNEGNNTTAQEDSPAGKEFWDRF